MTAPSRPTDFFTAGGTLRLDSPSYVKRPADDELFELALAGQFCYVLTTRQLGKSSLMVRTARRLQEHGASTAIIDLTKIGTGEITVDQWYLGLTTRLKAELNLTADPDTWWAERASLDPVQRFTDFLRDAVLPETDGPVVIFIDEIDSTLNLDFSDDFFAAIRAMYNARASDPELNRLTFVLLGLATPTDLIKDRTRTPFNIGQGIALQEFSRADAQVLEQGVEATHPGQGEAILAHIFHWTDGHPYLTQKLCLAVTETSDGTWTDERVDRLVEELFLSEKARRDTNLQFVQDSIQANPQRRKLLGLYRKVYEGREVADDARSPDQNRLKLFGLVRAEQGLLRVRNEIYRRAFDLNWIKANMPVDWTRRIAVISTILAVVLGGLFSYTYRQGQQTAEARAQAFIDSFRGIPIADVRITSLAGLFELAGYEDRAQQLFYEGLSPDEQQTLFEKADPQAVGMQLATVVKGLYTELENNDQGNQLLEAMAQPLRELDDPMVVNLTIEIEQWTQGREAYAEGRYEQAVIAYSVAISLNNANQGTRFDRAVAYAASGQYNEALADFEETLLLDEKRASSVDNEIRSNGALYDTLTANRAQYSEFAAIVPTPTSTATWTPTPISTDTPTFTSTPTKTPTLVLPTSTPTNTPTPTLTNTPTPTSTPTPSPQLSDIIPMNSIVNDNLDAYGEPPTGDMILGGVPFYVSGCFGTQGELLRDRPTSATLKIDPLIPHPAKVFILMNSGDTYQHFNGFQLGTIDLRFSDGSLHTTQLIVGKNIREWQFTAPGVVSTTSSSDVQEVYRVKRAGEDFAVLDMLTITIPEQQRSSDLIEITFTDTSQDTMGSLDPGFFVAGVTVNTNRAANPSLHPTDTPTSSAPLGMVYVPNGEFIMGSNNTEVDYALQLCNEYYGDCQREWFSGEQSQHAVYLDAFHIDKTEVTNAQYRECAEAMACDTPRETAYYDNANYA